MLFGCGRIEYYNERSLDPDTLEAIERSNTTLLEGSWDLSKNNNRLYLDFKGRDYTLYVWKQDDLIVSDQGVVEHYMPGVIRLHSTLPNCSDRPHDAVVAHFDLNVSAGLRFTEPKGVGFFALDRALPIALPDPGLCLWDSEESLGLLLR